MPWYAVSDSGFSRSDLLQFLGVNREQRNQHRVAIFQFLQFYFTLIATLLAAELTLCTFAIPYILNNVKQPAQRAALFFLLALLPITVLLLIRLALTNTRKEYEKLIEYLTVEQKIEAALGLQQPLQLVKPPSGPLLYPDDEVFLYRRWIDGRMQFKTSQSFVSATISRRTGGAFSPLRRALIVLACTDILLLIALVTWAVVLLRRGA